MTLLGGLFNITLNHKENVMKVMHTVKYPARKEKEVKHVICDFCKCIIQDVKRHKVSEVVISHRFGESYGGDGGNGKEISFDSCPSCFDSKVVPALKLLDAEPSITEWDY